MKVTVDTNILVRGVMKDEPVQAAAADRLMRDAELLAVPLPTLCEFAWVLRRVYSLPRQQISEAIRLLVASANVATERKAVDAGLSMLDGGGDFADGVIAYQGPALGGEAFTSFDKKAVARLEALGVPAKLLA